MSRPLHIQTVLCPVEFSDFGRQETEVAVEVCRAFGARLVLHHNIVAISVGLARAWDWEATHAGDESYSRPETERRMKAILATVPPDVRAEGCISSGPVATVVLALARQTPADLIVLGSHGWSTEDHASVTERLIESAPCPVLTFHQESGVPPFRLRAVAGETLRAVVPTDLTVSSARAVSYACDLARRLSLHLDLLHVVPHALQDAQGRLRAAYAHLDAVIPPDLAGQVTPRVRVGAAADEILVYLRELKPTVAVIGEHARGLVRHFLTHDTAREVVHRASCPVWLVPT